MAQVKVGVVGLGAWGRNVARCLHELNECDLLACCDTNPASRALAELNWNVKTCETLDEMLEHYPSIQAIVISSPAITHYSLAKKALLADKDVFVEKPFTLEVAHAEELLRSPRHRTRRRASGVDRHRRHGTAARPLHPCRPPARRRRHPAPQRGRRRGSPRTGTPERGIPATQPGRTGLLVTPPAASTPGR